MHPLLLAGFLLTMASPFAAHDVPDSVTVAWWNVENFFDLRDDTLTADDEFTPTGDLHWTRKRFNTKRDGIYKTLLEMGLPDAVGLAEVENKWVLRELCQATPLKKVGYRYVHYDSPDRRGIDCAFLYRPDRLEVVGSHPIRVSNPERHFFTRDILQVEATTPAGDTLIFLVCHWPSKRGGDEAEVNRMLVAKTLRDTMNSLHAQHPSATILAMGDMNSSPDDPPIAQGMGFDGNYTNPEGIENLFSRKSDKRGSYKYQGQWDFIDAMFLLDGHGWANKVTRLLHYDHLLTDEKGGAGRRPKRTYRGPHYEGGLSDHLPLLLVLSNR